MKKVVGGFIRNKKKWLFGKRARWKTWQPLTWDIPGGHVKKAESIYAALVREIKEETNIEVYDARLIARFETMDNSNDDLFLYYIFIVTAWNGEPDNASKEHSKLRWFTADKLARKKLAHPQYITLINEVCYGKFANIFKK